MAVVKQPYSLEAGTAGKRIVVCDAVTDDDMHSIGSTMKSTKKLRFLAGCAGFAELLPDLLRLETRPAYMHRYPLPLLVVCGSLQETSLGQIRFAEERGTGSFVVSDAQLADESYPDSADGRRWIDEAAVLLRDGEDVLIRTKTVPFAEVSLNPEKAARSLAGITKAVLAGSPRCTLVVFGGDTAAAILSALEYPNLQIADELFPGVPLIYTMYSGKELCLITKAGGFGTEDILLRIREIASQRNLH